MYTAAEDLEQPLYSKLAREGRDALHRYRRQFMLFDINKDGRISPLEFQAVSMKMGFKMTTKDICVRIPSKQLTPYRDAFKRLDVTKRCFLLPEDLYKLVGEGLGYSTAKVKEFVWSFDENKDGEITLMEFVPLLDKYNELRIRLEEAFTTVDRNRDGFVDVAEATAAFGAEAADIGYLPEQVVERLEEYDLDKDGKLNLKEFKSFFDIDY